MISSIDQIYKELDINTSNLKCVSLNIESLPISIKDLGGDKALYYSKDKDWISGYINSHITLIYGLLENVKKEHITFILNDLEIPETIKIKNIEVFNNPKEPYVCVIANLNTNIIKFHKKLCMLPHINTRSNYRPHITLAYIKKEFYSDKLIYKLNRLYSNIEIKTKNIVFE